MCGRYVDPDEAAVERFWKIDRRNSNPFSPPRFNVAPTMQVAIVLRSKDGADELLNARWGLIPSWWNQDKPPALSFNARSEEAASKPMWRQSLRSQRCLIPARGWYEWNERQPARNPSGKKSHQPYFHYCPNAPLIAFAGIWSVWQREDQAPLLSCALLSKEAAPSISHIHHRMPVVLHPQQFADWLDPRQPAAELIAAARQDFRGYPVSTRVNSARNEGEELLQEVALDPTVPLF